MENRLNAGTNNNNTRNNDNRIIHTQNRLLSSLIVFGVHTGMNRID